MRVLLQWYRVPTQIKARVRVELLTVHARAWLAEDPVNPNPTLLHAADQTLA